jgi:competence protein ComGC
MKLEIIKEIFEFLIKKKKFWLIPIIIILLLIGLIIVITEGSAIAPFIYTLF